MPNSDGESIYRRKLKRKLSIMSCLVSIISVFCTQSTLFLLPQVLPYSSLITLVPLSALLVIAVIGLGRCCKKVLGVRTSAPAFVFFSILFIWAVYIFVVRQVISLVMDIVFNIEIVMVVIGLFSIMSVDPGFVNYQSSCLDTSGKGYPNEVEEHGRVREYLPEESITVLGRLRYCRHCDEYVMAFDHHCPAFDTAKSLTSTEIGREVVLIAWHIYCACFNITTDEWVNWKNYPEFQTIPYSGITQTAIQFKNPYDKGIVKNLKEFITAKG